MLEIHNLTKQFPGKTVFKDFSLSLPGTGLFFLVGANGSGKSTLIYILSGLDMDYKGSVLLEGLDLKKMTEQERDNLRKKDIGLLFSHGNLFSFLNVGENLCFDSPSNPLDFIDLPLTRSVRGLSGGEELLLSLSNELSKNKKIYLLNEVTSSLYESHLKTVMSLLYKQAEKSLIVLATHDSRIILESKSIHLQLLKP